MNLKLSARQELRLKLEERLEQKLKIQIKQVITLQQYLAQEDIIQSLMQYADDHNIWVEFKKSGFQFNYANIPYIMAKPIADITGPGFAHCHYNPFQGKTMGDWTLFVVSDIPGKELSKPLIQGIDSSWSLADFVAIHERGEELSLGNHFFASKLEFAYVQSAKKMNQYVQFIDGHYPTKFIDLTQQVDFPILPEELLSMLAKQGKKNVQELDISEKLMDNYPLPTVVLKKMYSYDNITQAVDKFIKDFVGQTQKILYDEKIRTPNITPERVAEIINDMYRVTLTSIPQEGIRVISRNKINETLITCHKDLNYESMRLCERSISMIDSLDEAYRLALEGKKLVTANLTVEDDIIRSDQDINSHSRAIITSEQKYNV